MKFKRHDIVIPVGKNGTPDGSYGRVWRRIDATHVQVVGSSRHVVIYNESELMLANDYKGYHQYGSDRPTKIIALPSLRLLKKDAAYYNAHFGSYHGFRGHRWTKAERKEALADRTVSERHW